MENMFFPDKREFRKLARKGNVIPIYREYLADMETPVSAFMKIDTGKYSYLLESVEGGEKIGQFSFLGSNPSLIIKSQKDRIEILKKHGKGFKKEVRNSPEGPLSEISRIIRNYKFVKVPGLPRFCGGLVGFLGYDCVRFFEELPDKNSGIQGIGDSIFMLTDTILIFDHVHHNIKIVSNVHLDGKSRKADDLDRIYDESIAKIKSLARLLKRPLSGKKKNVRSVKMQVESNFKKREFEKAVEKAKDYIRAGDIIQTVLSQRFRVKINVPEFDIYRSLRIVNPSPYMYYLKFGDFKLIGSSPEVMVRYESGTAEVRPIAGTRPRGRNEEEDARLSAELLRDPKEIAEHIMLLDLGRNDLGRVCDYGTVKVREMMAIEKYSHVMHIVSDVQGRLSRGKDAFDVLRATFPAGTVSGAPKIRAMEIIEELENVRRGPYAGCVGYFSFSGNLDACITIRTIVLYGKTAYIQAGAGIVADSVPEKEYQETVNKARALVRAIQIAEEGLI